MTTIKRDSKPKSTTQLEPLGLVGRCFHIMDEGGYVEKQGVIRGDLGGGLYLIQYFEWLMGNPTNMEIVDLETIRKWRLYYDHEYMNFWYEHRAKKRPV
jgi:hypothetical protein